MMRGVPHSQVAEIWPTILPYLVKTLETDPRGYYQAEDVKGFLENRQMQLWVAEEDGEFVFFQITQILNYPRKKVLQFMWSGGNLYKDLQSHLCFVEKWAASNGCHSFETFGRKGWSKVVQGYELLYWMAYKYAENQ